MCSKAAGTGGVVWCRVRRGTSHHLRGKDGWQLGGLRTGPAVGPAYSFQRWQPVSPHPHPTATTNTFFLPSDFDLPPNEDSVSVPSL